MEISLTRVGSHLFNRRHTARVLARVKWPQDKYEELRSVGKGSFGDVFLVRRRKDDRQFVLKKMHVRF